MFRFFLNKKWWLWSWFGSIIILGSLWVQVKIDVKINEWFGVFYDMIQKALATPNAITANEGLPSNPVRTYCNDINWSYNCVIPSCGLST